MLLSQSAVPICQTNMVHDVRPQHAGFGAKEQSNSHGRKITEIDQDSGISLVQHDAEIQGRHEHEPEFDFDAANIPVTTTGAEITTASTSEGVQQMQKIKIKQRWKSLNQQ
ncbi:hypothetical protein Tco_0058572 [Tanacetum coccineum]